MMCTFAAQPYRYFALMLCQNAQSSTEVSGIVGNVERIDENNGGKQRGIYRDKQSLNHFLSEE
uniref:Uncharacterized protein n=1 Tax=Onchocerca volvulus TaxID=6282 RepID=A0A8R1XUL8_ONCVO